MKKEKIKKKICKAVFMEVLPDLLRLWEQKTEKAITFDAWLLSIYNEVKGEKE